MVTKQLKLIVVVSCFISIAVLAGCGSQSQSTGSLIATERAGNLTVSFSNPKGRFSEGDNDFTVEFKDGGGKPVDAGAITINFDMPAMGSMAHMHSGAKLMTTDKPGVYRGTVNLDMNGSWEVSVIYKGAAGEGKGNFSIIAK